MSNLYPGDEVDPREAGRLLNEQAARLAGRDVDEAAHLLRRTSNEGLLKAFAALTHRLHAADRSRDPQRIVLAVRVRSQRDRVQSEILRRMDRGE